MIYELFNSGFKYKNIPGNNNVMFSIYIFLCCSWVLLGNWIQCVFHVTYYKEQNYGNTLWLLQYEMFGSIVLFMKIVLWLTHNWDYVYKLLHIYSHLLSSKANKKLYLHF